MNTVADFLHGRIDGAAPGTGTVPGLMTRETVDGSHDGGLRAVHLQAIWLDE